MKSVLLLLLRRTPPWAGSRFLCKNKLIRSSCSVGCVLLFVCDFYVTTKQQVSKRDVVVVVAGVVAW